MTRRFHFSYVRADGTLARFKPDRRNQPLFDSGEISVDWPPHLRRVTHAAWRRRAIELAGFGLAWSLLFGTATLIAWSAVIWFSVKDASQ